jgi:hypothetical protein
MVPDNFKLEMLGISWQTILEGLAQGIPDGEEPIVTGDDVIDFMALGAAVIINQDTNLRTTRDRRLAVETVAKRVDSWVRDLARISEETGAPAIDAMKTLGTAAQARYAAEAAAANDTLQ